MPLGLKKKKKEKTNSKNYTIFQILCQLKKIIAEFFRIK